MSNCSALKSANFPHFFRDLRCENRELGAASWAPLACLDTAAAAAVAVGSLNFKSQRAGRAAIDGWTRAPLFPSHAVPQPHLDWREKALSNFLPHYFLRLHLSRSLVSASFSCVRGHSEATPPSGRRFHRDYAKQLLWNAVSCSQTHADVTRVLSHPGTCSRVSLEKSATDAQKWPRPSPIPLTFLSLSSFLSRTTQNWMGSAISPNPCYTSLLYFAQPHGYVRRDCWSSLMLTYLRQTLI